MTGQPRRTVRGHVTAPDRAAPHGPDVEALTPNVTALGDGASKGAIKVKRGPAGGPRSDGVTVRVRGKTREPPVPPPRLLPVCPHRNAGEGKPWEDTGGQEERSHQTPPC